MKTNVYYCWYCDAHRELTNAAKNPLCGKCKREMEISIADMAKRERSGVERTSPRPKLRNGGVFCLPS